MGINNCFILQMRKFTSRDTEMLLFRQLISHNHKMKTPVSWFLVHCFSLHLLYILLILGQKLCLAMWNSNLRLIIFKKNKFFINIIKENKVFFIVYKLNHIESMGNVFSNYVGCQVVNESSSQSKNTQLPMNLVKCV